MSGTASPALAGGRQFLTFSQGNWGQRGGGIGLSSLCSAALDHSLLSHLAPFFHPPPSRHGRQDPICGHFLSHLYLKLSTIFLGKGRQALLIPQNTPPPTASPRSFSCFPPSRPDLRNDHLGPPALSTHGPLSSHLPMPPTPFPATTSGLINSPKSVMLQGLIRLLPH